MQRPGRFGRYQFSLARLMWQANLLGLVVAVVIKTRGAAIGVALGVGMLVAFLAPVIVLCYIGCSASWAWIRKRCTRSTPSPLPVRSSRHQRGGEDVPFDELD